nr:hypothetical protein [uncultured Fluviicola sp.]
MKIIFYLFLVIFICSCKKEQAKPLEHVDVVAPCEQDYALYDYDSVYYSGTPNFPDANYVIKFGLNNGDYYEFAFAKIPTTGFYSLNDPATPFIDDDFGFKCVSGFLAYTGFPSTSYTGKGIFVESNPKYLIISFCQQDAYIFPGFDEVTYSIKIKKEY